MKTMTFDFWSTLFREESQTETRNLRIRALCKCLERHGFSFSDTVIDRVLETIWQQARYTQMAMGIDIAPFGHVKRLCTALGLPDDKALFEEVYQVYTGVLILAPPVLLDHAAQVLDYLADRYRLAVICNTGATPGSVLREIMKKAGIYECFEAAVFSDELQIAKPNPKIFLHTLELIGGAPQESAHMGDDPLSDVIGARRAGMKAVWFAPDAEWTVPECNWHIRGWLELLEIF